MCDGEDFVKRFEQLFSCIITLVRVNICDLANSIQGQAEG